VRILRNYIQDERKFPVFLLEIKVHEVTVTKFFLPDMQTSFYCFILPTKTLSIWMWEILLMHLTHCGRVTQICVF